MQIDIPTALYKRIQAQAVPLEDTVLSVIERAMTALENSSCSPKPKSQSEAESGVKAYDSLNPPSLTHSKLESVMLDGERLQKPSLNWNRVMRTLMELAIKQGYAGEALAALFVVPAVVGEKIDEGYNYYAEGGVSVQGQDSNGCWKQIAAFADTLGINVRVLFAWKANPKAFAPGKKGILEIT